MINSSIITGRRCVDEGANKLFVDSLFMDYKELLYVLAWGNWSMLAFGSALCFLFLCKYRSFRNLSNYIIFNLLFSLSIFNATKLIQLFYFEHATVTDKQTCLFFIRLSMGWFSSWIFVTCFLGCLKHAAKGNLVLNHKYWKTNILAVGFASLLTVCPSYLSLGHYPALLAVVILPAYAAYLTTIMTVIETLVTKQKSNVYWGMVKPFTYQTSIVGILGTMHLGEYAPKFYNYTWLSMVVLQMFIFVVYLGSGDFYNLQVKCQKEQIKPIVKDVKNEVELVTVKDDK